jgi:hypothetical protein
VIALGTGSSACGVASGIWPEKWTDDERAALLKCLIKPEPVPPMDAFLQELLALLQKHGAEIDSGERSYNVAGGISSTAYLSVEVAGKDLKFFRLHAGTDLEKDLVF